MTEQEKKDRKFSMIMSGIVHGSLFLLLIFLVAWRQPDPPIPEYGIELNFGLEQAGFGDLERENDAQIEDTENDTPPDAEVESEEAPVEAPTEETPVEEVKVAPIQQPEEPVKEVVKEVVKETPQETVKAEVVQKAESAVKVEEKKVEKVEEKKEVETPPVEEKKVVEKPKPKPKPVVDERAVMGGGKKTDTNSTDPASNNQGKVADTRGNMGDPTGKATANGSKAGGADPGVSLSLEGWKWQAPPAEKDESQIDGIIKFSIEVDDRGTVINVTKIPGTTISDNTVIEFYKKQVEKLLFTQTDPSKAVAMTSRGEITFVIKTN
ncbi:MAG: outer membrane biosynthesis protein TonB [Roseivirga sp.]|jgi:outer membrane biosynthesis protein TonB